MWRILFDKKLNQYIIILPYNYAKLLYLQNVYNYARECVVEVIKQGMLNLKTCV